MPTELKPCFCGGKPELDLCGEGDILHSIIRAFVFCSDCEAESEYFNNLAGWDKELSDKCLNEAVTDWNRRVSND